VFTKHRFEQAVVGASLDAYHYSYPPVLLLLTAPLPSWPTCRRCSRGWRRVGTLSIAHCVWRCRAKARCCSRWPRRAVFINAVGGQNSTWTAALFGGGLSLLERRALLSGNLLVRFDERGVKTEP
jgi:hypothetical protein